MVAIKSKGGDCWHYVACVVLDGNSLVYGNRRDIRCDRIHEMQDNSKESDDNS